MKRVVFMIERFKKQNNISNNNVVAVRKRIQGDFRTHCHDFFEIEYIVDGNGEYMIDGQVYSLEPGMIFFITPVNFHEMKNVDIEIINIMFAGEFASPDALFLISDADISHVTSFQENDAKFVEALLMELLDSVKKEDTPYAATLLNSLLYKLGRTACKGIPANLSYVQSVMLYLQNNFRSNVTLFDAANKVALSPAYLSSIFPKEAGMGFKEYLNSLRFEYAKKLLLYSDMSISEICYDCGFDNYANFLRAFKKRFGVPPDTFRRSYV